MFQQVVEFLLEQLTQIGPAAVMGIAAGGFLLGVVGARLSRSILPLALVAAGTTIGWRMPQWFEWKIDPMGTAFGMAILLGLSGYLLTAVWEGVLFGALLGCSAGAVVWVVLGAGIAPDKPDLTGTVTAVDIGHALWQALPINLQIPLPIGVGLGLALGISFMASMPRLGRALLYSLVGMLVFVVSGAMALQKQNPNFLNSLPPTAWIQGAIFGGIVMVATMIQWLITPHRKRVKAVPASGKNADSDAPLIVTPPPAPAVTPSPTPPTAPTAPQAAVTPPVVTLPPVVILPQDTQPIVTQATQTQSTQKQPAQTGPAETQPIVTELPPRSAPARPPVFRG